MKNLNHYSYVVVDLNAVLDEENDLIESLIAFKVMYAPRLIILGLNASTSNKLLNDITIKAEIYDLIISTDNSEIENDINMCLFDEKLYIERIKRYINKLNLRYTFTKDNIKIFISGVKSKFSVTKNAINLATFLSEDIKARVSITGSTDNYLSKIADYYKFDNNYKNVEYYYDGSIPLNCNFNVIDVGILKKEKFEAINSLADIKIICSSSKESESDELIDLLNSLENEYNILLSFSSDKEKNRMKKLLKNFKHKIFFIDDFSELFDTRHGFIYRKIIDKYIIDNKLSK